VGQKVQEEQRALQAPRGHRAPEVRRASPAYKVHQAPKVREATLDPTGPPAPEAIGVRLVRPVRLDRRVRRVIQAHKDRPDPPLRPETMLRRADVTFSPSQFLLGVAVSSLFSLRGFPVLSKNIHRPHATTHSNAHS
jgi:hypothetical protein